MRMEQVKGGKIENKTRYIYEQLMKQTSGRCEENGGERRGGSKRWRDMEGRVDEERKDGESVHRTEEEERSK